jgi:hypothetical protein
MVGWQEPANYQRSTEEAVPASPGRPLRVTNHGGVTNLVISGGTGQRRQLPGGDLDFQRLDLERTGPG